MSASKLREKIFQSQDLITENVTVDEWGVTLQVRALNGKNRAKLLNDCMDKQGNMDLEKFYPDLLIASCYEPETNELVFDAADRDQLNTKSGGALEKVAQVAARLSGLTPTALGDATKNSQNIPNADSTSN